MLYSVIEFFHDQAQRPRVRELHGFNGCGYHYERHNKQSGSVVYRWFVNALLERAGADVRLSSTGAERGHLVRHIPVLDELSDELAAPPPGTRGEEGEIAGAIRLYRSRSATINQQRAAVVELANILERHRARLKDVEFRSGDAWDLFHIFNRFGLRHRDNGQQIDYDDAYLDWLYWTTLAAIHLVKSMPERESR